MNNIILIGLMGAGKSTIGKALATTLNYRFIDVDEEIVKHENMSINDIFLQKSENYFREIETQVIKEICKNNKTVISLGGGGFEKEINREILLNNGKVFYLYTDVNTLYERIKSDSSRPLLKCKNPKEKLQELLEKREVNYLKAHYKIDTTEKTVTEIVEELQKSITLNI